MKKYSALFAACLLSLTGMAQKSALEGSWVMLDSKGFPTTSVKVFMPDGRQIGLSFNSDFTNSSVWFMSEYRVLNDTSFVDHEFYHSAIDYQRDFNFTFHKESDSVMVTSYENYETNSHRAIVTERWKKMDRPLPVYSDEEWKSLQQKSMAEFDRLPKEGQTVEQYGKALYDKYQGEMKRKDLSRAYEALLIRAELDTTNLAWQRDLLDFYLENKSAPSVAEKIVNRFIRLTEAKAPTPADTSVVSAYRRKAYMYNFRGTYAKEQIRELATKIIDMETTVGHQPSKDYGLDYFLMAMSYLPEGKFDIIYDYSLKAIDIFEKSSDVSKNQLGEGYYLKAMAMMNLERQREAVDILLEKVVPLFVDEQGQPLPKVNNEVYPFIHECYLQLMHQNPKDKKLLKEYQQFMADKLLCGIFEATNKEYNLWGEYYVLELGPWTIEKPIMMDGQDPTLLQKGDQYVEVHVKEGEKLGGALRIVPVDAAKKKEVIRQWKAYKKNKK